MTLDNDSYNAARWACFLATLAFSIVIALIAFGMLSGLAADQQARPLEVTVNTMLASETLAGLSERLFQATILLLASMWGLAILARGETSVVLDEAPELGMFVTANIMLLLGVYSHWTFVWEISATLTSPPYGVTDIPSFMEFDVCYGLYAQLLSLVGGASSAALCVVSGKFWIPHRS